jgi:hypothetical protein
MNVMIDESLRAKVELLGICRLKLFRGNFLKFRVYKHTIVHRPTICCIVGTLLVVGSGRKK